MSTLFHVFFQQQRLLTNRLNEVLKQYDLFSSQWTIIYILHQFGPMTLTQIWRYLHVEAPTVTRTIMRLEKLGWVKRISGEDKREKIVQLTERTMEQFPSIEQSILAFEEEMIGSLTMMEQEQLIGLLLKMRGGE